MFNTSILPLFPQVLQRTHFPIDTSQEMMNLECLEWVDREDGTIISKRKDIIHLPQFERILNMCQRSLDYYAKEIMKWDIEVYITQSWISRQPKGTRLRAHTHPNSFVSGCIYFQNEGQNRIVFDDINGSIIHPKVVEHTAFNSKANYVATPPGTLLLWPSTVQHRTEANTSDKDRVCLAFNTFVRGDLGQPDASTFLHLD